MLLVLNNIFENHMKIRNKTVPAAYIILKKDGKVLLARRCNTGYEDGNYHITSGHVSELK